MQAYRLRFKSGFHVDSFGNSSYSRSESFIRSDTLSAALLSTYAIRYPEKIERVVKSPPFLLSSAFPFCNEVFFLPVPKGINLLDKNLLSGRENSSKDKTQEKALSLLADDEHSLRKKLKKVRFIPSDLWVGLLSSSRSRLKFKPLNGTKQPALVFIDKQGHESLFLFEGSDFLLPQTFSLRQTQTQKIQQDGQSSNLKLFANPSDIYPLDISKREEIQRVSVSRYNNQTQEGQLFSFSKTHYPFKLKISEAMTEDQIKSQTEDWAKNQTEDQTRNKTRNKTKDQIEDQTKDQTKDQIGKAKENNHPLPLSQEKLNSPQARELRSGLYFLSQFKNTEAQKEFEEILALLGDTGIGSDRTCGQGLFEFSKTDPSLIFKNLNNEKSKTGFEFSSFDSLPSDLFSQKGAQSHWISLSLFHPSREERGRLSALREEDLNYELIRRGGWIHNSPFRRKSLFMFTEGSGFKNVPSDVKLKGDVTDVTPSGCNLNHKVFRDGRGFFIRI